MCCMFIYQCLCFVMSIEHYKLICKVIQVLVIESYETDIQRSNAHPVTPDMSLSILDSRSVPVQHTPGSVAGPSLSPDTSQINECV